MISLNIIVPTYNNLKDLSKTLRSIDNAKNLNRVSVMVVDSSDNHEEVIELVSSFSTKYISVYLAPNGVYNAMNFAITNLMTGYVLFLNSGDLFLGDLNLVINEIESRKSDVIVFRQNAMYEGRYIYTFTADLMSIWPHQSTIYRVELHNKFGLYNERFRIVADQEFFDKLRTAMYLDIQFSGLVLAGYDLSGISSQCTIEMFKEICALKSNGFVIFGTLVKGGLRCCALKILGPRRYFLSTTFLFNRYSRL